MAKARRNRDKTERKLATELLSINEMPVLIGQLVRRFMKVKYLAMDGHFRHNQAVLMAHRNDLQLISKLRKDAAVYEKYEGKYGGRGAKKKYGTRLK